MLTSDGEKWRSHRRIMAPSFDHRSLVAYAPSMTAAAEAHLDQFDRAGDGAIVDIAEEMTQLTLQIISQTMFSGDSDDFKNLVGETLARGQEMLTFDIVDILPLIGPWHMRRNLDRISAVFGQLDASMHRLIQARTKAKDAPPRDLLDRLVAARDGESGVRMTEKEVRDEVVIIFLAGHETTAVAMTFVWYLLSQHPAAEAGLHAELESVLAGRAPTHADLANLPYTRMVIEEAMRLYPPAPGLSGRKPREDDEICGRKVPKAATITIMPWILHRHRALWENPDRFDPERFSAERSVDRPRFAYLPFGGGPRICIGAALAMMEASLILATFAQRYRLRLAADQDIELQHRVTLRPRDGIRMVLERRAR
jgi:cytochrome P450